MNWKVLKTEAAYQEAVKRTIGIFNLKKVRRKQTDWLYRWY